jgi:PAS domain S-box-containing protein
MDDRALLGDLSRDRLAGKPVPARYECRGINKNGTEIWLEIYSSLIEYNGKPAAQSAFMDITERKKAENALRESEERFRLIAETSDEIFWMDDVENQRTLYISPAHERIWGYPWQDLYGDPKAFYDHIYPEDRERVTATLALMKTGQPIDHEYRIIRPDGSIRRIWNRGYPVPEESGHVSRYVGVAQDITELRSAEQKLKESTEYLDQIINRIGDPIFVKDRKHRLLLVNAAFCAFAGMSREQLLGKTGYEFIPKEQSVSFWEQEENVFNSGKELVTEDSLTDGRGNVHTTMTRKALLTDKHGNKQIVGLIRDITEYKRLQAQFMQSQKMEAIGVLAGGVAHDFNNLLSVIKGYTELLMEDLALDDPRRLDLEQIDKAGQQATSLARQLLAFSRKQMLQPKILSLNEAVAEMSTMLRRLIGEDVSLVVNIRPDTGSVYADPAQLQQIVMNLAVNARDAMPQGGKLIIETANAEFDDDYIGDHSIAKAGSYVMLAISDSGVGMDATTQARIFEPFFTTKEKGKGTGLGLSTVYGIVKQSNGFIWVYSEPGRGTTFKIYLPRAERQTAKDRADGKSESGSRGFENVLVVEDEASVRALACRILRNRGYAVLEASNGEEALKIAEEYAGEIHLLLTDVVMPEMNGRELASKIEAIRPGIKALYISGYTDNAIVHHGMLDSDVAFLQKPFTVDCLVRRVREAISS